MVGGKIVNDLVKALQGIPNLGLSGADEYKKTIQLAKNITFLHIYFKNLGITQYSREENYGIWDVIGNASL